MRVLDVKHFLVFFDFLGFFYCVSLLCCLITFSVPQQKIRGSWTLLKYVFFPSLSSLPLISSSCPYQISVISRNLVGAGYEQCHEMAFGSHIGSGKTVQKLRR